MSDSTNTLKLVIDFDIGTAYSVLAFVLVSANEPDTLADSFVVYFNGKKEVEVEL